MDQLILILTLCGLFLTLILISAVVLVMHIKNWTQQRDKYYNDQMKETREYISELKERIIDVLNNVKR